MNTNQPDGARPMYVCPFCSSITFDASHRSLEFCDSCKRHAQDVVREMRLFLETADLADRVRVPNGILRAIQGADAHYELGLRGPSQLSRREPRVWEIPRDWLDRVIGRFEAEQPIAVKGDGGYPAYEATVSFTEPQRFGGFLMAPGEYRITRLS